MTELQNTPVKLSNSAPGWSGPVTENMLDSKKHKRLLGHRTFAEVVKTSCSEIYISGCKATEQSVYAHFYTPSLSWDFQNGG